MNTLERLTLGTWRYIYRGGQFYGRRGVIVRDMEKFSIDSAPQYEQHYNDNDFRAKLRRIAMQAGAKVLYPDLQLYYLLQSPRVPTKAKTLIIGALGYLILPADLVPDFIPVMGFTDDLTAIMMALRTMNRYVDTDIRHRAKEQTDKLLHQ